MNRVGLDGAEPQSCAWTPASVVQYLHEVLRRDPTIEVRHDRAARRSLAVIHAASDASTP